MKDTFGRSITYMRLSVTDKCNLRCRYCMPAEGVCKRSHTDMLTEDEMIMAVRAAAEIGVTKVRITGGEPLVKRNILSICERTAAVPGIEEVCITTNGILLPQLAPDLKKAGIKRLNLSIDTLDEEKYAYITRVGTMDKALAGIEAALSAGFEKVKVNSVLIGGFNDDEIEKLVSLTVDNPIDVRFIELMPMYDSGDFGKEAYLPADAVLDRVPALREVEGETGVARMFALPGAKGRVGLINPVSSHFCATCNRIRLTADGKLKPCLHSSTEYSIKGLSYEETLAQFKRAVLDKPECHAELSAESRSEAGRNMNQIGG